MDDSNLVIECIGGNIRAQQFLFNKFARKMMAVCLRYTKDKDQAEDVLQDGFVKVFLKLRDFKNDGSLEGWIRRIMVNTALDEIRKNLKFKGSFSLNETEQKFVNQEDIISGLAVSDLLDLISSMPQGYKVVFNMFAIEGYSHSEISELLGISENTSKSQYLRARAYLRQRIEKMEGER